MSFDYAQFIAVYPEFSDIPQATVEFKGNLGDKILSDTSWGDVRDEALFLWTAHRLALEYNIAKALKPTKRILSTLAWLARKVQAMPAYQIHIATVRWFHLTTRWKPIIHAQPTAWSFYH